MAQLASVGGLAGTRETVSQFGLLMNWSESASEGKPEDIMLGVSFSAFDPELTCRAALERKVKEKHYLNGAP